MMSELGCMVVQKWGLLTSLFFKLVVGIVRLETRCYDMHATFYQSLVLSFPILSLVMHIFLSVSVAIIVILIVITIS